MSAAPRQMRLGLFLRGVGHHLAAWRHPAARPRDSLNARHYRDLARAAERAKFDMVFLADSITARGWTAAPDVAGREGHIALFEPLTLLSALSSVTDHIGLVATASTTYNAPFSLARAFASLDHLSGGRAGWNVVTSSDPNEAGNFGLPAHPDHADRYRRGAEFLDVVLRLWDSWEDDAILADQESGVFYDRSKVHELAHRGAHFSVRGPLNVARPPQGHPVVVQAGSSEAGQDLAAATAEVVFTAQPTLAEAQVFYASLKGRLARHGRAENDLLIMPGIMPVIGRTAQEAADRHAKIQNLIHPSVGLHLLSQLLGGVDLSGHDPDGPLPAIADSNSGKSRLRLVSDLAGREGLTLRETYLAVAGARGHWTVIGTPEHIADQMEERFLSGGADGFNVMPPLLPSGFDDFANLVVPELQRRGLFRSEYEGLTLRDHLGLARPPSRFASPARRLA